jgi:hypothetical protein
VRDDSTREKVTDVRELPAGSACQLAAEGRSCQAYNQEAFRYFLALERDRAQRAGRPVLLVLATLGYRRINGFVAQKLFAGLWQCTRETDFIGWFRDGRVAGAAVTPRPDAPPLDVARAVHTRVTTVLADTLPRSARARLRVRLVTLLPKHAGDVGATATGPSGHDWASGL